MLETIAHLTPRFAPWRSVSRRWPGALSGDRAPQAGARRGPHHRHHLPFDSGGPGALSPQPRRGLLLGLRPRQKDSGSLRPQLRITKAGDEAVRRLLVGAAQYILGPFGPDSDLRRWGLKLAPQGGKAAKKRAVVAVARKLSVLLLRLWVTGRGLRALAQCPA